MRVQFPLKGFPGKISPVTSEKMHTSQELKAHIQPLLDSTTNLHCVIEFDNHFSIHFCENDGHQARSLRAYHLGDKCYRMEISEIFKYHMPEITDKELTDDLIGWLTEFLSVGVFTVVSAEPSSWQPLPNDQLVMCDFEEEIKAIEAQTDIMTLVRQLDDEVQAPQVTEIRNRAGSVIQKTEQKTSEQLQADEFNKFSKLAQNSKGIEFTINLTTNSLAYRLSVKLQNPRTGNKITLYQFRNSSTIGLTTIYSDKFSEPLRQYTPKHTPELQHIFNACIEKLATRDRV